MISINPPIHYAFFINNILLHEMHLTEVLEINQHIIFSGEEHVIMDKHKIEFMGLTTYQITLEKQKGE